MERRDEEYYQRELEEITQKSDVHISLEQFELLTGNQDEGEADENPDFEEE